MTTPIQPVSSDVQISGTEDLLAAVPHLLGFHPVDSLIVIGLHGNDPMSIGMTLRVDLPPPREQDAVAEQLALPLAQHRTDGVVLLVVGGQRRPPDIASPAEEPPAGASPAPDELPHRALTMRLELAFAASGIPVVHRLWLPGTARGARWACYDDADCGGTLPDPAATQLAAASVLAGAVTAGSREELVAGLASVDSPELARRARLLASASRAREPGSAGRGIVTLAVIRAAIRAAADAPPVLSDEEVVALSEALSDHRVRDACLVPAAEDAVAAENLWTALTRAAPPPERAEAACLLAFSAYLRGDGVLAGIALEQAEQADPGHRLTGLLRNALLFGLPPHRLRSACLKAAKFASQQLSKEDGHDERS